MERILLTGATGFVGSELSKALLEKYELHVLERYVTGRYGLDKGRDMFVHYANLSDYPAVRRIVKDVKPDYCLHIGALSAVSFSYDNFMEVSETNYLGTVNLAEMCYREVPDFKQFIFAGTSEEYGTTLKSMAKKLTEDSVLEPNSPYAVAKVAVDYYLRYMGKAYEFPYTIIRPFNTYGRKDNNHFFVERVITQMLNGGPVYLGDPAAIRDWVYIDDHVNGYVKAINNQKAIGETIQLCTGKGYTTKETAEKIAKIIGYNGKIKWGMTQHRPLDAYVLIGDNKKAQKILGWTPKYNFDEGVTKTINYWKEKLGK